MTTVPALDHLWTTTRELPAPAGRAVDAGTLARGMARGGDTVPHRHRHHECRSWHVRRSSLDLYSQLPGGFTLPARVTRSLWKGFAARSKVGGYMRRPMRGSAARDQ